MKFTFVMLTTMFLASQFSFAAGHESDEKERAGAPTSKTLECKEKRVGTKPYYKVQINGKHASIMRHFSPPTPPEDVASLECKVANSEVEAEKKQECPPKGYIDCQPPTTNPNCAPARRRWIRENCPDVSFTD